MLLITPHRGKMKEVTNYHVQGSPDHEHKNVLMGECAPHET